MDSSILRTADWLDSIRAGKQPKRNIDYGFEEAMSAHLGTLSLKLGRSFFPTHQAVYPSGD